MMYLLKFVLPKTVIRKALGLSLTSYGAALMLFGWEVLMILVGMLCAGLCIIIILIGDEFYLILSSLASIFGAEALLSGFMATVSTGQFKTASELTWTQWLIQGSWTLFDPRNWIIWSFYSISSIAYYTAIFYQNFFSWVYNVFFASFGVIGGWFILKAWWLWQSISLQAFDIIQSFSITGGLGQFAVYLGTGMFTVIYSTFGDIASITDIPSFGLAIWSFGRALTYEIFSIGASPLIGLHALSTGVAYSLTALSTGIIAVWNIAISDVVGILPAAANYAFDINAANQFFTNTYLVLPNITSVGLNLVVDFINNQLR